MQTPFIFVKQLVATNITSLGSALSDFWSHGLYRNRNSGTLREIGDNRLGSKSPVEGESKAYLVAIGSAQQQYTFLYKPKSYLYASASILDLFSPLEVFAEIYLSAFF